MKKFEIPLASKCLFAYEHFNHNNEKILLAFADEESAISAYKQLVFFDSGKSSDSNILHFPSLDTVPYDRVSPSAAILSKRANVLTALAGQSTPHIIVTAAQNLLTKLPTPDIFSNTTLI